MEKKSKASKSGLDIELLEKVGNRLNLIAHPMRIGIIELLLQKEKLSVTEIYTHFKIEQASASNHLRILKESGILASRRDGKRIIYSVKTASFKNMLECVGCILSA